MNYYGLNWSNKYDGFKEKERRQRLLPTVVRICFNFNHVRYCAMINFHFLKFISTREFWTIQRSHNSAFCHRVLRFMVTLWFMYFWLGLKVQSYPHCREDAFVSTKCCVLCVITPLAVDVSLFSLICFSHDRGVEDDGRLRPRLPRHLHQVLVRGQAGLPPVQAPPGPSRGFPLAGGSIWQCPG